MKRTLTAAVAAVALGAGTLAGCGTANDEEGVQGGSGGKQVSIAYIDWDEDVAITHVLKQVLQQHGYEVQLRHVSDAGPVYVALDKGQVDLYLDGWLPLTHKTYWDKYGANLTDVGVWYDNAKLTVAVPNYMKIDSVEQLPGVTSQIGGRIVGIEPGAGLTKAVTTAIEDYSLPLTQQTSSTAAMLAALKKATDARQPIAVALWRPHWAYSAFPIKDLKDPKGSLGKAEQMHVLARKNFAGDFPELNDMLKRLKMDDAQLADMEQTVLRKHKTPEAGAKAWLAAHPDFAGKFTG